MHKIFIIFIKAYQYLLSPFLGKNCRFYPSCSQYSKICFETLPIHRALYLSINRILKCHPWHPGGVDEPPK